MVEKKYIMINQNNVTFEHILLVMKTLGKFHAVSFALKDQEPDKFDEIVNNLEELFFVRDGPMSIHVNQAEKMAIDCIDDDNDIGLLEAILRLYEQNQYDQLVDLANGNGAEPYAVILHGDLWSNIGLWVKSIRFKRFIHTDIFQVTFGAITYSSSMTRPTTL